MARSLWTAATGLAAQQEAVDITSHNLANLNTTGYKLVQAKFQELASQTIRQPGAPVGDANQLPTGLQIGTGVRVAATQRTFTQGNVVPTDDELNVAIQGRGFLTVELPDGTQAYTRDGLLSVDQNGQLTTAGGYILQPPITVPDNALSLSIAKDGTVSITQPGAAGVNVQIGQLQLATFINPTGLESIGENLYLETDASGAPNLLQPGVDGAGLLLHKYVEASNVNIAAELVKMIIAQRGYEMNAKAVTTSDEMLKRLAQL